MSPADPIPSERLRILRIQSDEFLIVFVSLPVSILTIQLVHYDFNYQIEMSK